MDKPDIDKYSYAAARSSLFVILRHKSPHIHASPENLPHTFPSAIEPASGNCRVEPSLSLTPAHRPVVYEEKHLLGCSLVVRTRKLSNVAAENGPKETSSGRILRTSRAKGRRRKKFSSCANAVFVPLRLDFFRSISLPIVQSRPHRALLRVCWTVCVTGGSLGVPSQSCLPKRASQPFSFVSVLSLSPFVWFLFHIFR